MEKYMADMMSNLYGNPHSASSSSQLSTTRVENTRLSVLRFFKADPEHFDVVFVANATAGVKLVMDAFRGPPKGFAYGYHQDSHTSLVGVRESATSSRCLDSESVERWLSGAEDLVTDNPGSDVKLFAFPAQSNLDGRRLPQSWLERVRKLAHETSSTTYTLLDASALVSTSQLDLSDSSKAADFTVLSFYKVFGFPDLGALIVRKDAGAILQKRKYFGGGTVDVVVCLKEQWHAPKGQSLHETLEDGTLPFHNIIALDTAIDVHRSLYGSMDRIASHTAYLARRLFEGLKALKHANDEPVCVMYSQGYGAEKCSQEQGPTIAFNVKNGFGAWVTNIEFERLASIRNFHIRTGGLCNPGGISSALELQPWEMRRNFSAGLRCGGETDIYAGKITGAIRVSLGAMSTVGDVDAFLSFMDEFFVDKTVAPRCHETQTATASWDSLYVESLTVYPIKSCGGFDIPTSTSWEVKPEGLAWDREWCLVHQGTGQALSQKRYPKMALIQPRIDLEDGLLKIKYRGPVTSGQVREISIPLSSDPLFYKTLNNINSLASRVCGDAIIARTYSSPEVNKFFSDILDVPCSLARFPAGGSGPSSRHAKAHMQQHQRTKASKLKKPAPGSFPGLPTPPDSDGEMHKRPILLSNESPILAINRSSINRLNEEIEKSGGKPASASVFRANIVLASSTSEDRQQPYDEDHWESLHIGSETYQMLGSCRRCHMICVDQDTAEKNEEPFVTLAKTRRFESKVFFGSHMSHIPSPLPYKEHQFPVIKVGDKVSVG
ncbi:hypothetical protein ACMFMF_000476 [Clarireedia jacksonii]